MQENKKQFFRIANSNTEQGLWYTFNGEFTGLIHNEYKFCTNSALRMDFDEEIVGWLSAADSIENLLQWFTKKDIEGLKKYGYEIHVYEADEIKWYERFSHWVIKQSSSKCVAIVEI